MFLTMKCNCFIYLKDRIPGHQELIIGHIPSIFQENVGAISILLPMTTPF